MLRNKRFLSLFLTLALLVGIFGGLAPGVAFADGAKTITILHLNDIHGRVEANEREEAMGFALLKTKVDELRAANPNTLLLNAGDTLHGTTMINVTEGQTMIDLMNLVGFDAMVPGNHDFNYGYTRLLELNKMAKFPILAANVVNEKEESLFEEYTIKEVDGVKVGIFGLATDETKFKSHSKNTIGVDFTNAVEASKKMVAKLKAEGADVIIALAHLGIEGTTTMTSKEVAEKVEGIDLIVDGHSHEILNKLVGDTLIVQADSYTKNIGIVNIEILDGKIVNKTATLFGYEEALELTPNVEVAALIEKINEINAPIIDVVVGKTTVDLAGERVDVRTGETNLGNLIADAMIKATNADIAFANGGGIRASIPAGEVKVKDILGSFPFDNILAVVEVTGAEIMEAVEIGVNKYPEEAGHFLHVAGMTYSFNPAAEVGARVKEVLVGGEALDLGKTYKLVTNDFIAAGGDGYTMFKGKTVIAEGGLLSDVLIEYFKEAKEVAPVVEGRAVKVEEVVKPVEKPVEEVVIEAGFKKYLVKTDDVLWKIAKSFNTTWEKLAELNNLKDAHLIFPNQELLVPEM